MGERTKVVDFHFFADEEVLSQAAAAFVADLARDAITQRGLFSLALSGGATPKRLYELLASAPFCSENFWTQTVIFWADDRAVGPDHIHSNYLLAKKTFLDCVPIPEENVYRIRGELGARDAARILCDDLATAFGGEGLPRFDLVVLGMGKDGHTASLFPGMDSLNATRWVIAVENPPAHPKVDRVTMSFPVLNAARNAIFLVVGKEKRSTMQAVMKDPAAAERYPAARIEAEHTVWFVDEAAAGFQLPAL